MDKMDIAATRAFELAYLDEKVRVEESEDSFLVERSFVDIYAFWCARDDPGDELGLGSSLEDKCKRLAQSYDLHVYFPVGVIPFTPDGYRSEDGEFHSKMDEQIQSLLSEWQLDYIRLDSPDQERRARVVEDAVLKLAAAQRN